MKTRFTCIAALMAIFVMLVAPIASAQHGHDADHGHDHAAAHDAHGDAHGHDAHAAEAHDDAHGGHAISIGQIFSDKKFLGSVVTFSLMMFIIIYFGGKGVSKGLKARRDAVASEMEEAKRIKEEAEAKFAEYQKRLESLDDELATMKREMQEAGEAERDRIVTEAKEKAERMRADNDFMISQLFKQLQVDLKREAVESAVTAAEKTLVSQMSNADHDRIAKDYLDQVKNIAKEQRA